MAGGVLIVVAFYYWAIKFPYDRQAGLRICVVTHNVPQANEAVTLFSLGIGENGLERLKVCVDVAENREAHLSHEYWSENGERLGLILFSVHKCMRLGGARLLTRRFVLVLVVVLPTSPTPGCGARLACEADFERLAT